MDKKFPKQIPVFPLSGVIYFPRTNLPLNIFEERYLELVNDSFRNDKLMGMVQSKRENSLVYKVGCLGKISDYQETFEKNGLMINWKEFEKLDDSQKINTLSMIAPISNEEKQKLLETVSLEEKTNTMLNIIKFYSYENSFDKETIQ